MKHEDAIILSHIHVVEVMQVHPLLEYIFQDRETGKEMIFNMERIVEIIMKKSQRTHDNQGGYHHSQGKQTDPP